MISSFDRFRDLVRRKDRFLLTTHLNPDGDGLGSELALAWYLNSLGKHVRIVNESATPPFYHFLDPEETIETFDPARHTADMETSQVILILDTNQPSRLGRMKEAVMASKADKIVIDHHLDADPFADDLILDESSAATGQIVYQLLEHLRAPVLPPATAQALYVAIMTDTGSFRFPKTTSRVHRIVADLLEKGADPVAAHREIYERSSPGRMRLLGQALATLRTAHNDAVAYLTVTKQMFADTGTSEPDVDQFAPYTLMIGSVQIGLMFTELPGCIKISFRSRGDIAINRLAQEFGGNGHKNAAGARLMQGRLEETIKTVLERVARYLDT